MKIFAQENNTSNVRLGLLGEANNLILHLIEKVLESSQLSYMV